MDVNEHKSHGAGAVGVGRGGEAVTTTRRNKPNNRENTGIFLGDFITHSIAQPDHYHCVFILTEKIMDHIQSTATFHCLFMIVTIPGLDSQPFHRACEMVVKVLTVRRESQTTRKSVYGRGRHAFMQWMETVLQPRALSCSSQAQFMKS